MEKTVKRKKDSDKHIAEIVEEIIRMSERKSPVESIVEENPKPVETAWESEVPKENPGESFIAHQNYVMLSRNYQLFLESLNKPYVINLQKAAELYSSTDERKTETGFEVINYKERMQIARNVQMNALLGGGHNHVPPRDMESYKYWAIASKFNQLLSFLMYDRVTGGG